MIDFILCHHHYTLMFVGIAVAFGLSIYLGEK